MENDLFLANEEPITAKFMQELMALFVKHSMAIVPTYEGEISFHDAMRVIPFSGDEAVEFLNETGVNPEDFSKVT